MAEDFPCTGRSEGGPDPENGIATLTPNQVYAPLGLWYCDTADTHTHTLLFTAQRDTR